MKSESEKAIKSIERSIANIGKQIHILRNEFPKAMLYVEDVVNYSTMSGKYHTDNFFTKIH